MDKRELKTCAQLIFCGAVFLLLAYLASWLRHKTQPFWSYFFNFQ